MQNGTTGVSSGTRFFKENIGVEMMKLFRNKRASITVVATLILLVVSVLMAGVGSYFAINVTGTRIQQEKLYLSSVSV